MKLKLIPLLIIQLFGIIFLYSGCSPNKCKDVTCQNGGICSNGTCNCATGYEGALCETKSVDKLAGTYSSSGMAQALWGGTITTSSSFVDRINIRMNTDTNGSNCGCGFTFYATVSGNNITIPSQTFLAGNETISGSGTINATISSITITLTINNTINGGSCSCFTSGSLTLTKI